MNWLLSERMVYIPGSQLGSFVNLAPICKQMRVHDRSVDFVGIKLQGLRKQSLVIKVIDIANPLDYAITSTLSGPVGTPTRALAFGFKTHQALAIVIKSDQGLIASP